MAEQEKTNESLLFPALGLSMATGGPPLIALSLLLIDISETLGVQVAVLGQISTISSFLSIIMAIIMGVLAVRYSHKLLLGLGLVLICVSIVGTSLSNSFTSLLVLYSLSGIGYSMTLPMVTTYIGELYPPEGRTKVMGRLISVRSVASIIAPLVTGYIVARSNWRIGFASYSLVLTVVSLVFVYFGIPSNKEHKHGNTNQLAGISAVLRNRSALAYLVAGSLATALFMAISVFNGSYLRQHFALSIDAVSQLLPLTAISITVGLLVSNRLVARLGLKKVVYLSTFLAAVSYLVYFAAGLSLTLALVFSVIGALLTGIRLATSSALGLVQETTYRGSMMSLNTASMNLGGVFGALIGGFALLRYGYWGLGVVASGLSVVASVIYVLWVKNT